MAVASVRAIFFRLTHRKSRDIGQCFVSKRNKLKNQRRMTRPKCIRQVECVFEAAKAGKQKHHQLAQVFLLNMSFKQFL